MQVEGRGLNRFQHRSRDLADTLDRGQFCRLCHQHAGQSPEPVDQVFRQRFDITPGDRCAKQDFQNFVILNSCCAAIQETGPQSLPVLQVMRRRGRLRGVCVSWLLLHREGGRGR